MKKFFLLFLAFFALVAVRAQLVPRQMVVAEDATGTWCPYCPGAQMGCEDLLANGKFVAVIANHNGDGYANTYSNARNSLYNIQYFPGIVFDGTLGYEGGSNTQSQYNKYLPKYNTQMADSSEATITMEVTNSGLDYTAVITVTKVGNITATNLKLHFFATQSHIHQHWQGQDSLHKVNRLMVPNQNGTAIDFSGGNTQTVTLNFTLNSAWPIDDCEFVVALQNMDAGQGSISGMTGVKKYIIYQAIKRGTIDLNVDFSASETEVNTNVPVAFTNLTTGGYVGPVPETYEWLFPGANPSTSVERNPTVTYTDQGDFDVTLIVNRGGQIDTVTKTAYIKSSWPTGVKENSNSFNARIFPNPNSGTFIVSMNTTKATVADLTVTNTAGAVFYKETGVSINGQMQKTIQLSNIASGIYYLTVQNADSKSVQKIVVK
jgi:PKD repeat protein